MINQEDTFEFDLTVPIEVYGKVDDKNSIVKCKKLYLKGTTYQHSTVEIEIEQLFYDGKLNIAGRNIFNKSKKEEEEKEMTLKEKIDLAKMVYIGGGVNITKLF